MCPLDTVIVRSQGLNPAFFTESWCDPAATPTVEGVLPTKFPSISMSAPSGVEDTSNSAAASWSGDTGGASVGAGFGVAAGDAEGTSCVAGTGGCGRNEGRWLKLCEVQLHVTADVRRHLGAFGDGDILPMHEEKDWGAGQTIKLVATMPPAIIPV
jgi:hypothetical protein